MAHIISFRTARFDITAEPANPINPIAGKSVLEWLRTELMEAGYRTTEPDVEDWGWYIDVHAAGASYLVGASAETRGSAADVDWVVQVHKTRSVKDRLLRRNAMNVDDPVSALIERAVRADSRIGEVAVDRER